MANRLEDKIRDFLAAHLDILEDGLRLVQTEYLITNTWGADGRIDIVARDKFAHIVVIEVKRSNQAARQALHEICKYTALFRQQQGLDQTQVRVMVVSTDWHELRVPFSEYAEATPYPLQGLSIQVEADGTVTKAEPITLLPRAGLIRFSREQGAYLFLTEAKRDAALAPLVALAQSAQLTDFWIAKIDYHGTNSGVYLRFGLYLVFASPLFSLLPAEIDQLKKGRQWDDELDAPDENFLVRVNNSFLGTPDGIEIGYPEKLTNLRSHWHIVIAVRMGRLDGTQSLLSDEELLRLGQFVDGGSSTYIGKVSSPRFKAGWRLLRDDITTVLLGMPHWESIVPQILDEVEAADENATVSVSLYNPANLVMSLYTVAWSGDFSNCPHLEIVVTSDALQGTRVLMSVLVWNGTPLAETPERVIADVYDGLDGWLIASQLHQTFEREVAALKAHDLFAAVLEFRYVKGAELPPHVVDVSGGTLRRALFVPESFKSMAEFAESNAAYLSSLKAYIEEHASGLPGSLETSE